MKTKYFILWVLIFLSDSPANQLFIGDSYFSPDKKEYYEPASVNTKIVKESVINGQQTPDSKEMYNLIFSTLSKKSFYIINKLEGTFCEEISQKNVEGSLMIISWNKKKAGIKERPDFVINKLLTDKGWEQALDFAADGPDGTYFAFSKNDNWCFVRGQWNLETDLYQFTVICGKFSSNK